MAEFWDNCSERLFDICQRPEKFLECDSELLNKAKILTKDFYDNVKKVENGKYNKITLPELIIDNFDEEQIWTGVELQNKAVEEDLSLKIQELLAVAQNRPKLFNIFELSDNDYGELIPWSKIENTLHKILFIAEKKSDEGSLDEDEVDEEEDLEDLMDGDSDSDEDNLSDVPMVVINRL